ncbi:hypothetical protein SCUCBS95973_006016 [Sporothrix curviconia]|uniref:GH16 domain-containing protein n=1 Tax=Sporothrix curviconia TaxID=1260050 RepID=A0ABP0C1X8_9PEZI
MDSTDNEPDTPDYGQAVSSNTIVMALNSPEPRLADSRPPTRGASISIPASPRPPRSNGSESRFRGHFSGPFSPGPYSGRSSGIFMIRPAPPPPTPAPAPPQKDMRPYFRSRRIVKGTLDRPELRKKDPRWIWINIVPVVGILLGLAIIAVLSWTGYRSVVNHTYCLVFDDDFSNGINASIWQYEIQTGGYDNGEFEITTADVENVFIRDGQLVIRPTLQTEAYLQSTTVVNLTSAGTCTSNVPGDCILQVNNTAEDIVMPVKSGRLFTKNTAVIRYGRVEVEAKLAAGQWLLSQMIMMPAENYYGSWPASGEINIGIARGNNATYNGGNGNQRVQSNLYWGPDTTEEPWQYTTGTRDSLHSEYHEQFHTFGLEWTEDYIFVWVDYRLAQVFYTKFRRDGFWGLGGFPATYSNGSLIVNPWTGPGTGPATPFDRPFYLALGVGVGGTSGWFDDGVQGKPWSDKSTAPRLDFWNARDQWAPSWNQTGAGEMVVRKVTMWQQCDNGATDLSAFGASAKRKNKR